MKFSVKINGAQFLEFDVKDPVKAAELVSSLTEISSSCEPSTSLTDNVFGENEVGTIEHVLDGLRGTKTSVFIKLLAGLEGFGDTDSVIKQKMSDGSINLAPYVASISKACKRGGIEISSIFIRKEKRIRAGKVLYHYQLTKDAASYVNSIDDFTKDEYFDDQSAESDGGQIEKQAVDGCEIVPPLKSNRERAREAGKEPSSITELSKQSGLTKPQVRGVINAPSEKDDWERKASTDLFGKAEMLYSYRPRTKYSRK